MKLKPFKGEGCAGYSLWCAGCGHRHMIYTENPPGKPVWTFNGDLERPVFGPSLLVWWDEPANAGNEAALKADIEEKHRTGRPIPRVDKRCHSFIGCNGAQPGQIIFLGDCTHELAGQVRDLQDIPS